MTYQARIILAKQEKHECGGNAYRKDYTIKSFAFTDSRNVIDEKRRLSNEMRGTGNVKPYVWSDHVMPGKCFAVTLVEKKTSSCRWRTYTWRIGASEDAVKAALDKSVADDRNALSHTIQHLECVPDKLNDTSFGVRG